MSAQGPIAIEGRKKCSTREGQGGNGGESEASKRLALIAFPLCIPWIIPLYTVSGGVSRGVCRGKTGRGDTRSFFQQCK